jgi:hypothetical protein
LGVTLNPTAIHPDSGLRRRFDAFTHLDLGFFDDQCSRVECAPNPFTAKVLPVSPVQNVT